MYETLPEEEKAIKMIPQYRRPFFNQSILAVTVLPSPPILAKASSLLGSGLVSADGKTVSLNETFIIPKMTVERAIQDFLKTSATLLATTMAENPGYTVQLSHLTPGNLTMNILLPSLMVGAGSGTTGTPIPGIYRVTIFAQLLQNGPDIKGTIKINGVLRAKAFRPPLSPPSVSPVPLPTP